MTYTPRTHTPGFYCLILHLQEPAKLKAGNRPLEIFPAGYYVYCGSALAGLEARLARHFRSDKRPHWHIDTLTETGTILETWAGESAIRMECNCAKAVLGLPQARLIHRGFGASDCRCGGHLIWLLNRPEMEEVLPLLEQAQPGIRMYRALVLGEKASREG